MLNPFWKKSSNPLEIAHKVSDIIEIGYSQHGPSLAISGVLTTASKIAFIHDLSISIYNRNNQEQYLFSWLAFRPRNFKMGGLGGIDFKMASKFMLTPEEPFEYNIFFSDQETYTNIKPIIKFLKEAWLTKSGLGISEAEKPADRFQRFLESVMVQDAMEKLRLLTYWEAREYTVSIEVSLKNTAEKLKQLRHFKLSPEDVRSLQDNIVIILADICQQPGVQYKFIQTKLYG